MRNYRLADPAAKIPVPSLGGALFPAGEAGLPVDPAVPFFARLIREGALVEAKPQRPARPAKSNTKGD